MSDSVKEVEDALEWAEIVGGNSITEIRLKILAAEVRRQRKELAGCLYGALPRVPVVNESLITETILCDVAPEIQNLIHSEMRSCLESAAMEIRRLYFDAAWIHIDKAQIYRSAFKTKTK